MTDNRPLSAREQDAKLAASAFEMSGQGYTQAEIARMLGLTPQKLSKLMKRVAARVPAEDAGHWRKVQLLEYERLKRALEGVLDAHHVVVSNGHVVTQYVFDDEGKPVWDVVYGTDGEPKTNSDGEIEVRQRQTPLRDNAVVLDAVAELRKVNEAISKLLGLAIQQKQTVEVQHVEYTITGVDMSKLTGANITSPVQSEGT